MKRKIECIICIKKDAQEVRTRPLSTFLSIHHFTKKLNLTFTFLYIPIYPLSLRCIIALALALASVSAST